MKPAIALLLALAPLSLAAQQQPDALHTALYQSLDRVQLGNDNARWSLTARVQYLDHNKPTESGTIQFFYAARDQRRIAFDFLTFHQVVTHTAQGHRSDGDGGETPPGLYELLHFLQDPASRSALDNAALKSFHIHKRGIHLDCIHAVESSDHPASLALRDQAFCTMPGSSALRYVRLSNTYQLLFENIGSFQGSDVPLVADILFANMPIAHVRLTYAPLTPDEQAQIHPSLTAQPVRNNTLNRSARMQLSLAVLHPGDHRLFAHPAVMLDPTDATLLVRLQFDPDGIVTNAHVIASKDPTRAAAFAASLKGQLIAEPYATSRFANFTLVTADHVDIYGDDFPPLGGNPAMIAAPPIADH